jgi:hypothetical protein
LYAKVLSATDRDHLITNIVGHLNDGVKPEMQQRAEHFRQLALSLLATKDRGHRSCVHDSRFR